MTVTETETLLLVGEACSGLGEGASFTALEWVRREFLAKLGFEETRRFVDHHPKWPEGWPHVELRLTRPA